MTLQSIYLLISISSKFSCSFNSFLYNVSYSSIISSYTILLSTSFSLRHLSKKFSFFPMFPLYNSLILSQKGFLYVFQNNSTIDSLYSFISFSFSFNCSVIFFCYLIIVLSDCLIFLFFYKFPLILLPVYKFLLILFRN